MTRKKISHTFNEYFRNIIKSLNLHESTRNINFGNEESHEKIKKSFSNECFSFQTVSKKEMLNLIMELPRNKAIVSNDIPVSNYISGISLLKKSTSVYYE